MNLVDLARSALPAELVTAQTMHRPAIASELEKHAAIRKLIARLVELEPDKWTPEDVRDDTATCCRDADSALICLCDLVRQKEGQ